MEKDLEQQTSAVRKVVVFGPESTGKTTLSGQLAEHYNTLWVPEYAREYLQQKWDDNGKSCEVEDLLPIGRGQIRLENDYTKKAKNILICDTDLLETKVYSEIYYGGYCDPLLEKFAVRNNYNLYLLTYIDVPWEKDDLRDKPLEREAIFQYFKSTLEKYNRTFVTLKGDKEIRLRQAIVAIDNILNND